MQGNFAGLHGPELVCRHWASRKQLFRNVWSTGELRPVAGHAGVQGTLGHQHRLLSVLEGFWEGDHWARTGLQGLCRTVYSGHMAGAKHYLMPFHQHG